MRARLILAAVPLAALTLAACSFDFGDDNDGAGVAGSGSGNARTYQVADFTTVALRGSDDVDVKVGGGFSVRAEGDPEVLEYLKIEKDGDTLKIGRRNRAGFSWGDRSAKIFVTMPRIAGAKIAGSGDLAVDRVPGGDFAVGSAGSGTVAVGQLAAGNIDIDIAGSGGFRGAGTAQRVKIAIAGSGSVAAAGLKATGADISIAGSGDVKFAVAGEAKVTIMGSGDVDLGPEARCSVTKMGSGSVRCGSQ